MIGDIPWAVVIAIVSGIIQGIVALAVIRVRIESLRDIVNQKIEALRERVGLVAATADKAHSRIDALHGKGERA